MKAIRLSLLVVSFITILFILACEKDKQEINKGIYTGTFTATYASGPQTTPTTIVLGDSDDYTCTTRGSGTYSVTNGKVIFNDEGIWTADFDWGLILDGEYNYIYNGTHLKIWTENDVALYEYNLQRVTESENDL